MSLFYAYDDVDEDARQDAISERRRAARWNHWCDICHGHLGPGSPCAPEEPEDNEERDE